MNIEDGIIINGELHEGVEKTVSCSLCSLYNVCAELNYAVCPAEILRCESFVNRGKVTVTSYYRETPKNVGEIIKNR